MSKFVAFIVLAAMTTLPGFRDQQMKFDRVKSAYREKEESVRQLLREHNSDKPYRLFLRAFKWEKQLEVWVQPDGSASYQLLTTYPFCTSSGVLGPKRREGDLQIPEGVYSINHFNPFSTFHLSLGINYPNASDRILSDKQHPGSAIYIHGDCVSIGCIPITDEKIKELYILAVEARERGQETIPVHIFPARLPHGRIDEIQEFVAAPPETVAFWKNLESVYQDFETTKRLRKISVDAQGRYLLK